MADTTQIGCACGETCLEVIGEPIASVECCCTSCRAAGDRMQSLEDAPQTLTDHGTTPFVMYRKDRVRFLAGRDGLKSFRLSPKHTSERVIATCCNTPVYLEFKGGALAEPLRRVVAGWHDACAGNAHDGLRLSRWHNAT